MFNDYLSPDQCQVLISQLAECAFPFQCAHGRPSMIPLVDLGSLEHAASIHVRKGDSVAATFRNWKTQRQQQTDVRNR
jgi:DNA mismatch repair protein MLH3